MIIEVSLVLASILQLVACTCFVTFMLTPRFPLRINMALTMVGYIIVLILGRWLEPLLIPKMVAMNLAFLLVVTYINYVLVLLLWLIPVTVRMHRKRRFSKATLRNFALYPMSHLMALLGFYVILAQWPSRPMALYFAASALVCIFVNLMDNAIKAVKDLGAADRRISIKADVDEQFLIVKTENPYEPSAYQKGKGVGQVILRDIADKYHGDFVVMPQDDSFLFGFAL